MERIYGDMKMILLWKRHCKCCMMCLRITAANTVSDWQIQSLTDCLTALSNGNDNSSCIVCSDNLPDYCSTNNTIMRFLSSERLVKVVSVILTIDICTCNGLCDYLHARLWIRLNTLKTLWLNLHGNEKAGELTELSNIRLLLITLNYSSNLTTSMFLCG